MTPEQLAHRLDQVENLLCHEQVPLDVKLAIEDTLLKLQGEFYVLWLENRRLRRLGTSKAARQVWKWLRRINLS